MGKRKKEKRKKNLQSIKKSYNIFIFFSKIQVYKKQYQDKDILKKTPLFLFFKQVESTESNLDSSEYFVCLNKYI